LPSTVIRVRRRMSLFGANREGKLEPPPAWMTRRIGG
jgi:hypothetical protein